MHRVAASCLLLLAFSVHEAAAGPAPADPASGIEAAGLMADIATLSDPATRGRLPGDPAFDRVVDAMAERFAGLGLRPGGDEGFRQNFAIESNIIPGPCRLALAGPDGAMQDLTLGDDYIWRGFTGGGEIEAPVVFAGYGLASSDRGYDDYDDIDVAGKIVLAFKQAPRWRPGDGEGWGDAASPRPKALAAAVRGARGLLLVSRPGDDHPQPVIGSVMHGPGVQPMDVPQAQISLEQAARLFAGGLDELRGLQVEIDEARAPRSRELEARARMEVRPRYDPRAATANVVGILPGSDPDLAGQCVVMGAHLDHVGKQGDVVFPGANDNASGSAAVVAAAAALARAPESPRRSIVFVLFAGEEQGLLGAEHYAAHPAIPLESTVAMINLDCVAEGDSLRLGCGETYPGLWNLARRIDAAHDALSVERTWAGGGADATPFHRAGVPTLYFAAENGYRHLHLPSDTVETLDPGVLRAAARLACRVVMAVADGDYEREEPRPRD